MLTPKEQVLAAFSAENELKFDAHCHYHWASLPKVSDIAAFINTATPQEFLEVSDITANWAKVGLGLHPWYVKQSDINIFVELLPTTKFVGEIGLDFSKKFTDVQKRAQVEVFEEVCSAMSDTKIISVHAFKTQGTTHQILKETGVLENSIVIYHWFVDGPSE